jgi:cbb3-type cytochrome oxidase subunit 1
MGARLIKISAVYFVIGVLLGMYMSMTEKMLLTPVHAHVNLLGWASLALAGLVYAAFPAAAETALAKWHFWLHNIGLPVMMISLVFFLTGSTWATPIIAIGGVLTVIGVILFAINIFKNVK